MSSSKPTFIFFGLPWCGHCVTLADGHPATASTPAVPAEWPILRDDPELKGKINMKKITWNMKATPPIPLPVEYSKLVGWGPYLYLEASNEGGVTKGATYASSAPRTAKALKAWIIETIKTDPLFASSKNLFGGNTGIKSAAITGNLVNTRKPVGKPQKAIVAAANNNPAARNVMAARKPPTIPNKGASKVASKAAIKTNSVDQRLKALSKSEKAKEMDKDEDHEDIVSSDSEDEVQDNKKNKKEEKTSFSYRSANTRVKALHDFGYNDSNSGQ
jgi:hypothetical protein